MREKKETEKRKKKVTERRKRMKEGHQIDQWREPSAAGWRSVVWSHGYGSLRRSGAQLTLMENRSQLAHTPM